MVRGADAAQRFGQRWQGYVYDELMVPMRDGVRLHTFVFRPEFMHQPLPIILTRTPYGWARAEEDPYSAGEIAGEWCIHSCMIDEGYIFVAQDERGRWGSEGDFELLQPFHSERNPDAVDNITDTHDTIDWALKTIQHNNGCVGLNGNSYRGWHVMAGLVRPHPAVRAAVPSAACSEGFIGDDFYHNGAFAVAQALWFFTVHMDLYAHEQYGDNPFTNQYAGIDLYDFFLEAGNSENLRPMFPASSPITDSIIRNDRFNEFWAAREVRRALHRTPQVPTLHVNNWYDVEDQYGQLAFYQEMASRDRSDIVKIVSGPWVHGGWRFGESRDYGPFDFGSATASHFRDDILGPFFRHHLKGDAAPQLPKAYMFDCGDKRWRSFSAWPPVEAVRHYLYLTPGGLLDFNPPEGKSGEMAYISDPANPVPFLPRPNTLGWTDDYKAFDQAFSSARDDVLVFLTEPLEKDLTLSGEVLAELFASSEGSDTDFVVKLVDVYPDDCDEEELRGFHRLVLGDILRAKFRDSFVEPVPLEPGKIEHYRFSLLERLYTFKQGHRVGVHVQSSWFPLFDRNPNAFGHIPSMPLEGFIAVQNRIFMHQGCASRLCLDVLEE